MEKFPLPSIEARSARDVLASENKSAHMFTMGKDLSLQKGGGNFEKLVAVRVLQECQKKP